MLLTLRACLYFPIPRKPIHQAILNLWLSSNLSICLTTDQSVYLSIYVSMLLIVRVCLYFSAQGALAKTHLAACLSINPSIYLIISLSIYLCIYASNGPWLLVFRVNPP